MTTTNVHDLDEIGAVISDAKDLARRYYRLTGRPLGITGEVAEYEAARLLGLELADVRQAGYDAIRKIGTQTQRIQVKGRCILSKKPGQRIGSIDLKKDWDSIVLVLLDGEFSPTSLYEADRAAVEKALTEPGSKARNERGALSVSQFKSIGDLVWSQASKNDI